QSSLDGVGRDDKMTVVLNLDLTRQRVSDGAILSLPPPYDGRVGRQPGESRDGIYRHRIGDAVLFAGLFLAVYKDHQLLVFRRHRNAPLAMQAIERSAAL